MELDLRRSIRDSFFAVVGRHDEPSVFLDAPGDPGLVGPGSVSWEVNGNLGAVSAAGGAAIVMELLHPGVMAGVHDHSRVREDPLRRARTTMGYVLVTTFGTTKAATRTIDAVKRVHGRINGTQPDGRPYRALDPELIAWVHTCIPWAILEAYSRYVRPLSEAEKDAYLLEQSVIGLRGGAEEVPTTYASLLSYVDDMRPRLAVNEQLAGFVDFLTGRDEVGLREHLERLGSLQASMSLMPDWAQRLTGLHTLDPVRRLWLEPNARLQVRLLNWAIGTPACKRLAMQRVAGSPAAVAAA
jgi:uncharacterized protein (DUF2236 family)